METLLFLDHFLFHKINQAWTNGVLDWILPRITDLHKSPIFVGLVVCGLIYWIYDERLRAAKVILLLVISVALSDSISYRIIKATVERSRPAESGIKVQLRTHSHSGKSFPSNHAANIFAFANLAGFAIPYLHPFLLFFAFSVAYSRVYVGVHFPLDVLVGALLGLAISTLLWRLGRGWVESKLRNIDKVGTRSPFPDYENGDRKRARKKKKGKRAET